ncbi:hypothetical protein A6U85_27465 [Agrobacterium sp. 13-626]|nr:hypothetical protein A6U85_27465 [Agrobacterium sp. 13-626]
MLGTTIAQVGDRGRNAFALRFCSSLKSLVMLRQLFAGTVRARIYHGGDQKTGRNSYKLYQFSCSLEQSPLVTDGVNLVPRFAPSVPLRGKNELFFRRSKLGV